MRVLPVNAGTDIYNSMLRLYPASESLTTRAQIQELVQNELRAWHTRQVYNACRGWQWPHWINLQVHPASLAYSSSATQAPLRNVHGREAYPVTGKSSEFAGYLDRRGMFVPPGGRFSIETWVYVGDTLLCPANVLNESNFKYTYSKHGASVSMTFGAATLQVSSHSFEMDNATYVRLSATAEMPVSDNRPVSVLFAIRPYSLESVIQLKDLVYNSKGFWMSDSRIIAWSLQRPHTAWASNAELGDAALFIDHPPERTAVRCSAGLATAISLHQSETVGAHSADMVIPVEPALAKTFPFAPILRELSNRQAGKSTPKEIVTNSDNADDITGFILPLLTDVTKSEVRADLEKQHHCFASLVTALCKQERYDRAASVLNLVLLSIQRNGTLDFAHGHWELYGQLLVSLKAFKEFSPSANHSHVLAYSQIRLLARWIIRKRRAVATSPNKPKGLLPPGLTRTGIGIEYNVVDNLWSIEGLAAAADLARMFNEHQDADIYKKEAEILAHRLSAAIHRELEYSIDQLPPGRLYRGFDVDSASELLDLAFLPNTRRMMGNVEWFTKLTSYLATKASEIARSTATPLRNIDRYGFHPARRLLLALAVRQNNPALAAELNVENASLHTSLGLWNSCVNPTSGLGCGSTFVDLEATSLIATISKK